MRKLFTYLGISTLVCLSFIMTEKTAMVVRENDTLMQTIRERQDSYRVDPIDAVVSDNTIIPGLNGKEMDVDKSYDGMRKLNSFNDKYITYKTLQPNVSYKKQYDKYIVSGNAKKNMVSLIFMVYDNDDIEPIVDILGDINATFFVDGKWFESNNNLVLELIKRGHTIGNLSYNLNYDDSGYVWINNILKRVGKQKVGYCYYTESDNNLKACALQKNYTIKPSVVVENSPLIEVKKSISSGALISFRVNDEVIKELPLIMNYIKQKGYVLENLENHLSENLS